MLSPAALLAAPVLLSLHLYTLIPSATCTWPLPRGGPSPVPRRCSSPQHLKRHLIDSISGPTTQEGGMARGDLAPLCLPSLYAATLRKRITCLYGVAENAQQRRQQRVADRHINAVSRQTRRLAVGCANTSARRRCVAQRLLVYLAYLLGDSPHYHARNARLWRVICGWRHARLFFSQNTAFDRISWCFALRLWAWRHLVLRRSLRLLCGAMM